MDKKRNGWTHPARLERIADLLFEAGMLRHTPRSGWYYLGTGREDVAQHSFRMALISFVLARMTGADPYKAAAMGLFHDLHEARTCDLNYMHQRYAETDQRRAQADSCAGTGLEEEITGFLDEFEERATPEAIVAKDADQLDLILNLKVELDNGNRFAADWLESAVKRLRTEEARSLAEIILRTHHSHWWHARVEKSWWIDRIRSGAAGEEQPCSSRRGSLRLPRRRKKPSK